MKEFERLAKLHYKKEITSKEFESEIIKIGYELQAQLPEETGIDAFIEVNREIIEAGKSRNGGYSKDQARILGTTMKNNKGWLRGLTSQWITQQQIDRFIELKDSFL